MTANSPLKKAHDRRESGNTATRYSGGILSTRSATGNRNFLLPGNVAHTDSDSGTVKQGNLGNQDGNSIGNSTGSSIQLKQTRVQTTKTRRVNFVSMEEDSKHDSDSSTDDVEMDAEKFRRNGVNSQRFLQPRMSLLGRPLNYRQHRRDIRYRRLQAKIYNFLERPKFWSAWIYHIAVFAMVILCLVLSVLASIQEFQKMLSCYVMYTEIVMLLWIASEFMLRLWASGCRSRYQGLRGRLRFFKRPLCIIDFILVAASITTLGIGGSQDMFATSSLRGLRFFQILRMVRMDRRGGTWKLLGSVVWAHRQELITTLYIGSLGLIFSSFLVYLVEKDALGTAYGKDGGPIKRFSSFADALWWGVVTLCTVGYGDIVPTTWAGKLIASFSAILGISFFALPAGILGSGFALKVQQQQRQKHLNRRRIPAAMLIQSLWRCYAADEHSMSVATWKIHLVRLPSPTAERERPWKNQQSFVSRFSTRRRDRSSNNNSSFTKCDQSTTNIHSPMVPRHNSGRRVTTSSMGGPEEEVPDALQSLVNRTWYIVKSHLSLATGLSDQKPQESIPVKKENSVSSICREFDQDEPEVLARVTNLTEQHKKAIRSLRKIKYFVARRKFREALRPYDVKDVIEQYSAGHIDMLARVKNLQGRLDQILGKAGSKNKDVYDSKQSLASRVVKVERQVDDIESKVDILIDMYKEDRKLLLQHLQTHYSVNNTPSPAPSTAHSSNQPKPRPKPILVDKQFTSEPATPTGASHPVRPMQRNLSDLSQRIKKRVTYRCLSLNDSLKLKSENNRKVSVTVIRGNRDKETIHVPTTNLSTSVSENSILTRDSSSSSPPDVSSGKSDDVFVFEDSGHSSIPEKPNPTFTIQCETGDGKS